MPRVARLDFLDTRIDLEPGAQVSEGSSPATWTADGYLVVDSYLARDGLLEYSDGESRWLELRPREELVKAAASWHGTPVTNDHPPAMVKPETWKDFAVGSVLDAPTMTDPNPAGVSYLRARLMVTDKDTLEAIRGGLRELSIGFTSLVEPAPNGVGYQAVQTDLVGNHVALVKRGRAGPAVRLLMDSRDPARGYDTLAWCTGRGAGDSIDMEHDEQKEDQAGAPQSMVKIVGPDGVEIMVPTWAAEMIKLGQQAQAASEQPAPAEPQEPAPPVDPEQDQLPPRMPGEAEEDESMSEKIKDAVDEARAQARAEARLARKAARLGVPDEKIDACESYEDLAREILSVKCPKLDAAGWSKDRLDGALALVDVPAESEARADSGVSPIWQAAPKPKRVAPEARVDAADEIMLRKAEQIMKGKA